MNNSTHIHWLAVCLLFFCSLNCGQSAKLAKVEDDDKTALRDRRAGETVSADAVRFFNIDSCFLKTPIPQNVLYLMRGNSYKDNNHIKLNDLCYVKVLHWGFDNKIHIGEMVCNRIIADKLVIIFRTLYEQGYQIEKMELPDKYNADDELQMRANNSSCFLYRNISGSKQLSKHARGLAVDINPLYNPYYKDQANGTRKVQPATAKKYCDRTKSFPHKIDHNDLAFKLFTQYGFKWGGDWKSCKDFQHFEW